jgi:hypothetical protein
VVEHCDGCVAYHAKAAAAAGASEDEVVEALGVALLMNGGPASVWAPRALEAFREASDPYRAGRPDPTVRHGELSEPYGRSGACIAGEVL